MTHFSIPSFSQNEISELHTSNEKYTLKILDTGQRSVSTKRRVKKNKNKNKNVPHCSLWLMAVIAAFVCTDNYPSVASSWVQQVSKQRSGNMDGKYISLIFQFTRILNCTTSSAILCVSSSLPPPLSAACLPSSTTLLEHCVNYRRHNHHNGLTPPTDNRRAACHVIVCLLHGGSLFSFHRFSRVEQWSQAEQFTVLQ